LATTKAEFLRDGKIIDIPEYENWLGPGCGFSACDDVFTREIVKVA